MPPGSQRDPLHDHAKFLQLQQNPVWENTRGSLALHYSGKAETPY